VAKCDVNMPTNLLSLISRLGEKTDKICEKVLEEGVEVVYDKVKSNLEDVGGKDTKYESRSTGELVEALGVSPVKHDEKGNYDIKIGFAEPRKDGIPNGKIAAILEYGKSGQLPKPFMKPAKTATRKKAIAKMQSVLQEEIDKL